jgi:putative protein-disulfide isomerase
MHAPPATLYYVHDPMCSWCWGYRPAWLALKSGLPPGVVVANVVGGLAPDTDEEMPEAMRLKIQAHWRRIEGLLGTAFNFDFWTCCHPRRDTYKACRAVVAARRHGLEEEMIEAIQRAYYERALNPSEPDVLARLGGEIGLDEAAFRDELYDERTESAFQVQLSLARELGVDSFPSLVLESPGGRRRIQVDYRNPASTLSAIGEILQADAEAGGEPLPVGRSA